MARPRKQSTAGSTSLSGGQASYVLERLIKDRRVSQTDINRYVTEMKNEISDLENRLQRLKDAAGAAVASVAAAGAAGAAAAVAVVRGRRGRPPGSGKRRGRPPGRPAAATADAGGAGGAAGAKRGAKRGGRGSTPITAEQLASRQLQGRYLALVRQFPEARRAQYARIAREKGREAAITEMQGSLRK